MYPNLYYLFQDLFGLELPFLRVFQSFGALVACSFLAAYYVMKAELKRKEQEGLLFPKQRITPYAKLVAQRNQDVISYAITGFLIGFKFIPLLTDAANQTNPQDFILSTQGSWELGLLFAAVFGLGMFWYNKKYPLKIEDLVETVHPNQIMGNLTMVAALSGILGAKLFHNFENWSEFTQDPIGSLISFSGLTFYGGLIVGGVAVIYVAAKNGINWKYMLDAGGPAMMLAYGLGRLGCHVSGDGDWGIVNMAPKPNWLNWAPDWFWSYRYPHNVLEEGELIPGCLGPYCRQLEFPVFPTPLYEIIACLILFGVLWAIRKRVKIHGVLFSVYLIMNGLERYLIEKIRVNNKMDFLGLTQAEMISFSLMLLGLLGIFWCYKSHKTKNTN